MMLVAFSITCSVVADRRLSRYTRAWRVAHPKNWFVSGNMDDVKQRRYTYLADTQGPLTHDTPRLGLTRREGR